MFYLYVIMGKNAKYDDFNDYYQEVYSRLSSRAKNQKTSEELKEMLYDFYYKDVVDTMAVMITESVYSIFKKYLR